jgi:hypothetical protein
MENYGFIKLYKNDFQSAINADDTPVQKLRAGGFIVQKPNEYFQITTSGDTSISFAGGIQIDLIDCQGNVKLNIDNNFGYTTAIDSNGVSQISFAFGYIGIDFWTTQLHLRITDLVNANVWYSNGFLITYFRTDLSTRFDYFNPTKIYNISYDLLPYVQSIRFAECYDQTPANKRDLKQYVNLDGKQVNYRSITTFLRKYNIEAVDYSINDALEVLFSHGQVYCNSERVVISDYKVEDRKGDVNYLTGEFTINKQGQTLPLNYQIYPYLSVVSKTPAHLGVYTIATLPSIELLFNKNISISADFEIKLYKGGVLQSIAPTTYDITGNLLAITPSYSFTNGSYMIVIEPNLITAGAESFSGFGATEWTFTVADGEYDNTEYSNEYLLN